MSDDKGKNAAGGGIGLLGATFLVLLVLKLTDVPSMREVSWWWVTLPLWAVPALLLAFGLVAVLGAAFLDVRDWARGRGR